MEYGGRAWADRFLCCTLIAQLQCSCPQCNLHVALELTTYMHSSQSNFSSMRVVSVVPTGSSTSTLPTQQASLNLCAKSCPGFSSRFLVAVKDFAVSCAAMGVADVHVRYTSSWIGVFSGTLRRLNATLLIHRFPEQSGTLSHNSMWGLCTVAPIQNMVETNLIYQRWL